MFFGGGIPFAHAFPGGIPPGMGGGGDDGPAKEVDNSKLYEVLGVAKDASQTDIKKAYMKVRPSLPSCVHARPRSPASPRAARQDQPP